VTRKFNAFPFDSNIRTAHE